MIMIGTHRLERETFLLIEKRGGGGGEGKKGELHFFEGGPPERKGVYGGKGLLSLCSREGGLRMRKA